MMENIKRLAQIFCREDEIKECKKCGEITNKDICAFCELVEAQNKFSAKNKIKIAGIN